MKISRAGWGLIALILVDSVLQVNLVRRHSLWADEFFSLAIATGHSLEHPAKIAQSQLGDFIQPTTAVPTAEFRRFLEHESPPASLGRVIRAVILSDTSPPFYYLLLYGWTLLFGTSDVTLRLFSVSCSLASLPLIAAIAKRIAGKQAALVSCILFTFSPLIAYYSTEGRMYSLLIFLTLATAWTSLILQERGATFGYCLLWIVLSVAGFLTHYFFVFPWLANVLFLLLQPVKFQRRWLFLSLFLTGVAIVPWMWMAAASFSNWRVTGDWLHWKPAGFHRGRALVAQFLQFFSSEGHGLWRTPRWSALLALMLFALAGVAAAWRLRWQCFIGKRLLLWLWLFAGCAGPTAIDLLQHTYTADVPRYALGGVPAACLLAGVALPCLGSRLEIVLLCVVVVAWLPGLGNIFRQRARSSEPVRQMATLISSTAKSSDLILVHSIPSGVLGVSRYVNTPALIASWVGQLGNRAVPDSLLALAHGHSRILLVKVHDVGQAAPEEDWLRANSVTLDEKQMQAIRLIYFQPKTGTTF